jgi:hypothetical protein
VKISAGITGGNSKKCKKRIRNAANSGTFAFAICCGKGAMQEASASAEKSTFRAVYE